MLFAAFLEHGEGRVGVVIEGGGKLGGAVAGDGQAGAGFGAAVRE